jgi:hypothetical protein
VENGARHALEEAVDLKAVAGRPEGCNLKSKMTDANSRLASVHGSLLECYGLGIVARNILTMFPCFQFISTNMI